MQRKILAVVVLSGLAGMGWLTMEPGRPRWLVVILLAGFAVRILLARSGQGGNREAPSDSQPGAGSGYDRGDGG